jgi:hypothetical protein
LTGGTAGSTARRMHERVAQEEELSALAAAARKRRSVDLFVRAAVGGLCWALLAGVCGKLLWDSLIPPLYFWPLALLDTLLLWGAVRSYREGRTHLHREVRRESRVRELRKAMGIDP